MAKKLRFLFTLLFVMAATVSWGEDKTVTLTQSSLGLTGSYTSNTEKTIDGITYVYSDLMKNNTNIQAKASTGTIYNKTIFPSNIKNVAITHSGTARATTILGSVDGENWTTVKSGSGSISADFSGEDYKFFKITRGSNAAYWTKIEITYGEEASGPVDPDVSFVNESIEVEVGSTKTNAINKPSGLTVSYSSSNENVATVDAEGKVTGVAVGDATITVSWEVVPDKYNAGYKTFAVTVVPAPVMDVYEIVTDVNNLSAGDKLLFVSQDGKFAMSATQKTNNRDGVAVSALEGKISLSQDQTAVQVITLEGSSNGWYFNVGNGYLYAASSSNNQLKTQKNKDNNAKATISIESGTAHIQFQGSYSRNLLKFNSQDELFNCYSSGQEDIVIYKKASAASSVSTPIFTIADGEYLSSQTVEITCATDGATIYYTLDGADPTTSSTKYTGAISISETTILKAIAVKGADVSEVATAKYTFPTVYKTIAEFKTANTTGYLDLTGAQVVFIDSKKNNIYVRDDSGAIDLYNKSGFETELTAGDILSGIIKGTYTLYKNLPEITDIEDITKLTSSSNESVVAKEIEGTVSAIAANVCDLVKITKTTITQDGSNYYVGENVQLYDKFSANYNIETGVSADVVGIATIFNEAHEISPRTSADVVYYPAAPTFSLAAGSFDEVQTVTITAAEGTEIRYTTDGSDPNVESAKYENAITINEGTTTLKAVAVKDGLVSDVTSAEYTVTIPKAAQVGDETYRTFADAVAALTETNNVITLLADVEDEYTLTVGQTLNVIKGEFALTVNAPEGYELKISEADGITTYTSEAPVIIAPAAPIVFHDSGEYEAELSVPMYAQVGAKIYYTTDGSEPTTASTEYTGALTIEKATTVKAIAVLDGVASAVVTREYTIKAAAAEIEAIDGYYSIKNNGNEKYINVAGRKTVTFVADGDEADKAGTVLKVKINTKGQVEELRSQGVDLPGYADRAMNYVPKFVKLIVDKLHAEGSGEILGEHGLDAIMQKFNDSFDYHLYVEKAGEGYRIYGKTPSMKPVVDFYAENKDNVDYKLPQLEAFINSAIQKVLQKTGGRGASILTEFKLHDIWQKMGETLTEPVKDDAASIAKFYEEVLASEANVWNFAYQTAMIYWNNVKSHPRYEELKGKLGDYAKYLEKVENIQPDFKYYIVGNTSGNGVDFISQGNTDINAARAIWTMNERNDFAVTFTKENSLNIGRELYTTLYVDFAYTLPETVKAYKVPAIDEKTGLATKEEITGVIPAQTPVLLQMIVDPKTVTDADLTQTLTLSTEAGSAVAGNLLQGPEWLINKYSITAKQVEDLFGYVHDFLKLADVEALYDSYVKEYEYLMMRNAGTVNNKYFFGLSGDDIADADDVNVCQLAKQGNTRKRLAFYHNLEKVDANKAFIPSEKVEPVYLSLIGDVNRDGYVNITDVTCQIDIVLGKDKPEDNYDYDAADLDGNDEIRIDDVTDLIDVVLGKKIIE